MSKRINIVLPEKTLAVLDRVAPRGKRSQFISRAVLHLVESQGKATLRERLKQEALENAARDVQMAAEWFPIEEGTAGSMAIPERRGRNSKKRIA